MIFKFRDKNDKIGTLLGSVCFMPSFFIAIGIGMIKDNIILAIFIMFMCQFLWLISIELCTRSLEIENRHLKSKLKELEKEGE